MIDDSDSKILQNLKQGILSGRRMLTESEINWLRRDKVKTNNKIMKILNAHKENQS